MSDHSLLGFLERQTTEELYAILAYCLRDENRTSYADMVEVLQNALRKRKACGAYDAMIYSSRGDKLGYTERIRALIVLARLYNVSMDYICGVSDTRKSFPEG